MIIILIIIVKTIRMIMMMMMMMMVVVVVMMMMMMVVVVVVMMIMMIKATLDQHSNSRAFQRKVTKMCYQFRLRVSPFKAAIFTIYIYDVYCISRRQYHFFDVSVAQLVASVSGVVLGGVAEVVGSNLA